MANIKWVGKSGKVINSEGKSMTNLSIEKPSGMFSYRLKMGGTTLVSRPSIDDVKDWARDFFKSF